MIDDPKIKDTKAEDNSNSVENLVKASLKEASEFTTPTSSKRKTASTETETLDAVSASFNGDAPAEPKSTRMGEFAKTPMAAKLSGTYHETAGKLKRKFGEITKDPLLKEEGLNQELLGKVHRLVGSIRSIRTAAREKLAIKKVEGRKLLRKHSLKLLDVANELADDVKNLLLK